MSTMRPGALLFGCTAFAALAVPAGTAVWLRATNSFFGAITVIGSAGGQPRDISTGWIFVIFALVSAVVYAVPAGLAFIALRRATPSLRNAFTLMILPLSIALICLRLGGGS